MVRVTGRRNNVRKEAFVFWNGGDCHIVNRKDHSTIVTRNDFRRATRHARNLGFNVRVYKGDYAKAPRDAVHVSSGSYILPATTPKTRA